MPYYRLYFIDPSGGHIVEFREFEADDDDRAVAAAEHWRDGGSMELWNLKRKLRHWDAERLPDD